MNPFERLIQDFQDKKILILGLGTQGRGVGVARIFSQIGAQVKVTDLKTKNALASSLVQLAEYPNIDYTLGEHRQEDVDWADVVLRNAAVPWQDKVLEYARQTNTPIHMDAELFFRYIDRAKTIGVTGTRGKSTTTSLIFHILKQAGLPAILAGNITPTASLELLAEFQSESWYVCELSSWQLQAFHISGISPHVSVFTNLYPDHLLDRTYEEYAHDKAAIWRYQDSSDFLLLNSNNPHTRKLASEAAAQVVWFFSDQVDSSIISPLTGKHNLENVAAALQVAKLLEIDQPHQYLDSFSGLPYRLEDRGSIKGVRFVNDTTSTTPIATIKALEAYPDSLLILGGSTKKLPTKALIKQVNRSAKKIYLLVGTGTEEIKSALDKNKVSGEFSSLQKAFIQAFEEAVVEDVILFSPGFTSFGMFANEFDRGDQFNQLVTRFQERYESS